MTCFLDTRRRLYNTRNAVRRTSPELARQFNILIEQYANLRAAEGDAAGNLKRAISQTLRNIDLIKAGQYPATFEPLEPAEIVRRLQLGTHQ